MKILSNDEYNKMKFNSEVLEHRCVEKNTRIKELEEEIEKLKKDFISNYQYVITSDRKKQTEIYINGNKINRVTQIAFKQDTDGNFLINMEVD